MYEFDTNKLKEACFPKNFATSPADCQTLTHKHSSRMLRGNYIMKYLSFSLMESASIQQWSIS